MVATPVVWLRKIPITKCFMCLGSWWWNSWVLQPFTDVSIQLQVIHALLKCWTIMVRICWRHVGLSRKPWLQLLAMRLVKFILIRWGVGPFAYLCIHNVGSRGFLQHGRSALFTTDQEGKNAMKHFNSEAEFVDFASKERFPTQM